MIEPAANFRKIADDIHTERMKEQVEEINNTCKVLAMEGKYEKYFSMTPEPGLIDLLKKHGYSVKYEAAARAGETNSLWVSFKNAGDEY